MAIDYTKRPAKSAGGGGGVSLSKVTLTKSAPSVSLTKRGATGGQLRINLQWSAGEGQTSVAYLVGRDTKGEKMAPFRLDLGPRIFRGVGARLLPVGVRT